MRSCDHSGAGEGAVVATWNLSDLVVLMRGSSSVLKSANEAVVEGLVLRRENRSRLVDAASTFSPDAGGD